MTSELVFVGLGLSGVGGMTVSAMDALKGCDRIFAEFYTSSLIGTEAEELGAAIGREITVVYRQEVEEGHAIIDSARECRTAFVCPGDTMLATTHVDLRIQAVLENIPVRIFYGVSIFGACPAALGLQPYKFGRTVTVPFPEKGYHPKSPYDHIMENKKRGLHTMILLDIRAEELRYMTAHEAIEWLLASEEEWQEGLVGDKTVLCVVSHAGAPDQKVFAGYPYDLLDKDLGAPLQTVVLPGEMHFMEAEALVDFAGAPPEIVGDDRRWQGAFAFPPPKARAYGRG